MVLPASDHIDQPFSSRTWYVGGFDNTGADCVKVMADTPAQQARRARIAELNAQYAANEPNPLTKQEYNALPEAAQDEYLKQGIAKKFDVPVEQVSFSCGHCAESLFFDDGYITDGELLEALGLDDEWHM